MVAQEIETVIFGDDSDEERYYDNGNDRSDNGDKNNDDDSSDYEEEVQQRRNDNRRNNHDRNSSSFSSLNDNSMRQARRRVRWLPSPSSPTTATRRNKIIIVTETRTSLRIAVQPCRRHHGEAAVTISTATPSLMYYRMMTDLRGHDDATLPDRIPPHLCLRLPPPPPPTTTRRQSYTLKNISRRVPCSCPF
jgi:hypothetical protein